MVSVSVNLHRRDVDEHLELEWVFSVRVSVSVRVGVSAHVSVGVSVRVSVSFRIRVIAMSTNI